MAMTTFGIAKNHETSTCEAGHFSCQRLSISGTRSIVFVKVLDVAAFLESMGEQMVNIHPQKVYAFLKEANNDTMAKFAASHSVFHATVGPKELVHTPCGWAFAGRTMRNADVVGI
eukprot:11797256-Alexandrium_andersonii.AAC.1